MLDIVGKRFWYIILSAIISLICLIFLAAFGLNLGIDFSSGSILTVSFEKEVDPAQLKQAVVGLGYTTASIESNPQGDFLIHTTKMTTEEKNQLKDKLAAQFGTITEKAFENVDPVVAKETARIAGIGVIVATVGILLYMTWAFRHMPRPFRYGTCSVAALVFNILLVAGVFAIFGKIANWEVDLGFIIGILSVIGYTINNTVVVFDRIRENLTKGVSVKFEVVVNHSLVETLSRTLNTTITTLITILAILLFVGTSVQNFITSLLIGLLVGTFSSIYLAPLMLVVWEKKEWGKIFRPRRA